MQTTHWYRTNFFELVADFGALAIAVINSVKFVVGFFAEYARDRAMLSSLFGQSDSESLPRAKTMTDNNTFATKVLKSHIKGRSEFGGNYL